MMSLKDADKELPLFPELREITALYVISFNQQQTVSKVKSLLCPKNLRNTLPQCIVDLPGVG